jgi:N-acetylglutamate synthase-like GNAT family acetyltransferase
MYKIRQATSNDIPVLRSIAERSWLNGHFSSDTKQSALLLLDDFFAVEKISGLINDGVQFSLLLEEGIDPAAFVSWSRTPVALVIHQVYCLPATQGRGYVKILINEVARIARTEDRHTLDMKVGSLDLQRHFYESLGFRLVDGEIEALHTHLVKDHLMRWDL